MAQACPRCRCTAGEDGGAHRLQRALLDGDLDAALQAGLLDTRACTGCSDACNEALANARDGRLFAFAARERHRARDARLHRRKSERDAARRPAAPTATASSPSDLPPAAADALARALAKARERRR